MKITGGEMHKKEIAAYREYAKENKPGYTLVGIHVDGDYVDLEYEAIPFERIRRITGYLVGTLDRWNDAKQAEERDRVKHK